MLRMLREKYIAAEKAEEEEGTSSGVKDALREKIREELLIQYGGQYSNLLKEFKAKLITLIDVGRRLEDVQAEANEAAGPFFDGAGLDLAPAGRSTIEAVVNSDALAEFETRSRASGYDVD